MTLPRLRLELIYKIFYKIYFGTIPPKHLINQEQAAGYLMNSSDVLFLCHGNINRSPFAEEYFKSHCNEYNSVDSAGFYPVDGRTPPDIAVRIAKENHIDISNHQSKSISSINVRDYDVIFMMDSMNYYHYTKNINHTTDRVFFLSSFIDNYTYDIPDPNSGSERTYRRVFRTITNSIDKLIKYKNG